MRLGTRWIFLLLWLPFAAWGQSCPFWQALTFPDGSKGCLTDFAWAHQKPAGFSFTISQIVPRHGGVAFAQAMGPGCPRVVSAGFHDGLSSTPPGGIMAPGFVASRTDRALTACQSALGAARDAGCTCKIVVQDGEAKVSRDELVALGSGPGVAPSAGAVASVQVPGPQKPAAPMPSPSTQGPAGVPAQAAAAAAQKGEPSTSSELTAMRQELQDLRQQIGADRPRTGQAEPGKRLNVRALVIGNSGYQHFARLVNPANDARAIAQKLGSLGVKVDLVLDADRDAMVKALNDYSVRAAGTDVNILFYAGHGVQVEGVNYLVPVNMRTDGVSAGYVKLSGISLNATLDYLPARARIVFLDACRDNPLSRSLLATRSSSAIGLAPVTVTSGTLIAYATRDGATAEDGTGRNSPYTAALLQHLDSPMDISIVLRQVRQTVMSMTSNRQEPWEYGSLLGGELVLAKIAR
jgi:caspase domain-containing protein